MAGLGPGFQVVERLTGARPSVRRAPRRGVSSRTLLNADQVIEPAAQLFVVASGRLTPGVEEDRIGPFGVGHQVAQEGKHEKWLLTVVESMSLCLYENHNTLRISFFLNSVYGG